jgi:hypothetical protein
MEGPVAWPVLASSRLARPASAASDCLAPPEVSGTAHQVHHPSSLTPDVLTTISTMLVTAASCALRNTARRAASASTLPPRLAVRSVRPFSSTPLSLALKTRYTPEHEWVTLDSDSNIGTVGITDYAQKSLGDVVFVELPTEGTEVAQGGESAATR